MPDLINGLFESIAGFFILNNCRMVLKDKIIRGVSIISVCFFTSWGCWNLYYYPSLDQWFSFYGGIFIVISNVVWVGLMLYYAKRPHKAKWRNYEM